MFISGKKIGLASEAYLLLPTRQGIKPLSGIDLSADKDLNIPKTKTTNSNYFTKNPDKASRKFKMGIEMSKSGDFY